MLPEILTRLGANKDMIDFAARFATPQEAWDACTRPDWMFWVLSRTCVDVKTLTRLALDFAEYSAPHSNLEQAGTTARGKAAVHLVDPAVTRADVMNATVAVFSLAAVASDSVAASLASSGFAARAALADSPASAADAAYMAFSYASYVVPDRDSMPACSMIRARVPVIPL